MFLPRPHWLSSTNVSIKEAIRRAVAIDGAAAHLAAIAIDIEAGGAVHCTAVVPHDAFAGRPLVGVD